MKARQKGLEEVEGWKFLIKQAKAKIKIIDRIIRGNHDRRGIAGLLLMQKEKAVLASDFVFSTAKKVKEETLKDFSAERARSGNAEKKDTKAWYIRQAVNAVKNYNPTLDGDELYEEVGDYLQDHPPKEYPKLYDEGKEIRRTLRTMGYEIPRPNRTKDTFWPEV